MFDILIKQFQTAKAADLAAGRPRRRSAAKTYAELAEDDGEEAEASDVEMANEEEKSTS